MPPSPFPPRPVPTPRQDDPGASRSHSRPTPNTPARQSTLRSILRPTPLHDSQILRPQPATPSPYHHHHTSSSPELRPHVDNIAWAPRVRPYPHQRPPDPSHSFHSFSYVDPRPHDIAKRQSGFPARVNSHLVPGIRGRSASDARIAPPDLEPDRLARACGHPPPFGPYPNGDQSRHALPVDTPPLHLNNTGTARIIDSLPSHPSPPKIRVGHMYRRLDVLARRAGGRVMDYVTFGDLVTVHKRDSQLRGQLRRKRSERLQEKDPSFHAIGAPLEDVLLYASAPMVIGDYQHHLPIVVVACIEELTKTGIYQSGLFRALPSRDRHLHLIDLFDKSPDFGAHFNMRGQAMPDICALLSTFISSLPSPLLDPQIYAALWHWSIKPSVRRQDARRDQQEEEEEDRRARGEPPHPVAWMSHADLYIDDSDVALEADQISTAQILLRLLPSANLSLLMYLCAFFTQLPLCPENGLQLEDVARIFGNRLLGGAVKVMSQRMMMWLLTRWHRISETLFGEECGMTPPPSPPLPDGPTVPGEVSGLRIDKRKGKRQSTSDDALCLAPSSSSSYSSPSTESPEDHGTMHHKSSSDREEDETSEGSRRRKKRELDVQEPRKTAQTGHRHSTRKEPHQGHGHGRRGSGSRRHHRGHSSEQKNVPESPDPFAAAFAKAEHDLVDAPLLATPSGTPTRADTDFNDSNTPAVHPQSRFDTHHPTRETPVRIAGSNAEIDRDNDISEGRRIGGVNTINVDARVVDALLQERAATTDATRALAERVEVLERALKVRDAQEDQALERSTGQHQSDTNKVEDQDEENQGNQGSDRGVEDGLRLQLRLAEAERDRAQRILHDMRAYLLEGGMTFQR